MTLDRRAVLVCVVVLFVSLAGCAGSPIQKRGDSDAGAPADGGAKNAVKQERAPKGPDSLNAPTQRAVIRRGIVHSRVPAFDSARENLTQVVRKQGGYVSDSTEQTHDSDGSQHTSGRIVYRVPAQNFTVVFERVKREGKVVRSNTNTTDVTDRVADLDARLKNARAQRDRLRALYDNASNTEDVLAVGERLSSVQERIERLKARRKALSDQIAYATITVELEEQTPSNEESDQWHETGVLDAFLESVNGVVVVARAVIVGVAYILPYLIVFGLPLAGFGVLARWRRN